MMKKTRILPFGIEAIICTSLFSKAKGMMFSSKSKGPLIFIFNYEQKVLIHMFFVFFPLIVIWMDRDKRVTDFKILAPFEVYSPKTKSKYVLEIPFSDDKKVKKIKKRLKRGMHLKFRE